MQASETIGQLSIVLGRHRQPPHFEVNFDPCPLPIALSIAVYVFLGGHNGMVDMMTVLDQKGLLSTGEYVVIFTRFKTYDNESDPLFFFKSQYPTHDN
jgi:guanylate cyclase